MNNSQGGSYPGGGVLKTDGDKYREAKAKQDLDRAKMIVAQYDVGGKLIAIHLPVDFDWSDRLRAAEVKETPPEGGKYLIFANKSVTGCDVIEGKNHV